MVDWSIRFLQWQILPFSAFFVKQIFETDIVFYIPWNSDVQPGRVYFSVIHIGVRNLQLTGVVNKFMAPRL